MVTHEDAYLKKIKERVMKELGDESVKVILFGSRAGGRHHRSSDVDIGLIPRGPWNVRKLSSLKEKIEDLNVPYTVDFVDLNEVSAPFRRQALKEVIVWKD